MVPAVAAPLSSVAIARKAEAGARGGVLDGCGDIEMEGRIVLTGGAPGIGFFALGPVHRAPTSSIETAGPGLPNILTASFFPGASILAEGAISLSGLSSAEDTSQLEMTAQDLRYSGASTIAFGGGIGIFTTTHAATVEAGGSIGGGAGQVRFAYGDLATPPVILGPVAPATSLIHDAW